MKWTKDKPEQVDVYYWCMFEAYSDKGDCWIETAIVFVYRDKLGNAVFMHKDRDYLIDGMYGDTQWEGTMWSDQPLSMPEKMEV